MKLKLLLPILVLLLLNGTGFSQLAGTVRLLSTNEYQLPASAVAAGIDGKLVIGLTVDREGKSRDVRVYSTPMWPCGAKRPSSQIQEVQKTIEDHVMLLKFSPEMTDGKPKSVSAEITLMLSERIKGAANMPGRLYRPDLAEAGLVDMGALGGLAADLRRPSRLVQRRGIVMLQLLVNEKGEVASAGLLNGTPELGDAARDAACESRFRPATMKGRPVPMYGTLSYTFQ